ncbi:MAG: hypothetical protein QOG77_2565, partial [Solirubrobacteraceae bacterium]|nr:hypothetical protein [Solirubrobacteraceae bacterium]
MEPVVDVLDYINAGAALLLALVGAVQSRVVGRPGRWGAAAFAALAAALLILALDESRPDWETKAVLCCLLAFPYLMLRFAASFGAVPAVYTRLALWATAAMVVLTVALPSFPADDAAARPAWVNAYLFGLLAVWTVLSLATIMTLWRGGADQPTLARRRARLMGAAAAGMNVLLLLASVGVTGGEGALLVQGLLLVSLASFAVGFAPPAIVRLAWRQPEQEALGRATEQLVEATTVSEVTDTLLPHVARIVG